LCSRIPACGWKPKAIPTAPEQDDFNQKLSEKRALAVRDFLVEQGIPLTSLGAQGFGKGMPVASNDTAAGRQLNRRVELVVAGEVIGIPFAARRAEVLPGN
jgi:hypothetical protein